MRIIKENKDYKIPSWITTCYVCKSEFEFTLKDTKISFESMEHWVQCPVCGRWRRVLVNL